MAGVFGNNHSCSKKSKKAFSTFIKEYDLDPNNESKKIILPKNRINSNWINLDENLIDDQLLPKAPTYKERRYPSSESQIPKGLSILIGLAVGGLITFAILKFFIINYAGHSLY